MIDLIVKVAVFALCIIVPAAYVWLHMHHKAALREIEHDASELWSDIWDLKHKAESKDE